MNSAKKVLNQQNKTDKKSEKSKVSTSAAGKVRLGGSTGPNKKAIILGAICVVLVIVLCVGVGIQQLKPQVVLTVNDTKLTMDDMMYPIYEKESQYLPYDEMYQYYMGTSVWDTTYQGSDSNVSSSATNSEGLKQEIIDSETEYEVLYQEAVAADYTLTDDEKSDAKKQAEDALKGLSWIQKFQLSISKNNLTERFEKRILADRYKEDKQTELNKDVDEDSAIKDVSKKDYREYDLQFYYVATTTTDSDGNTKAISAKKKKKYAAEIKALAKKAATAKDFTKLISDSDKSDITYDTAEFTEQAGWSYVSTKNLKTIKKMKNGTISGVFLDDKTGYYVFVKMIDNNSTASYEDACDSAISDAQDEKYNEWLSDLETNSYTISVNSDIWDDVTIGSVTTEIVTADDLEAMSEDASSGSSDATSESN